MTDNRKSWDVPPLYFLAALMAELAIGLRPGAQFIYPPYHYIGVPFVLAGIGFAAAGVAHFRHAGTTVHPHEQPTALVTSGPFRLTRNPMYLGTFLVLVGLAFLLQRLLPFAFPFLYGWAISRRFIEPEEARLLDRFGQAYEDYASRVRRWV